mgnify:CR=1 FL=1
MAEAFVYDHIRTPRGRGKAVGSLHEVKPVDLVVGLLDELKTRNPTLDPARVDDVVLGVVTPIGDQGGDIAKTAALKAGYPETVAGVQLNRFCASGLEAVNQAAQRVRSGFEDLVIAGGVESMSRVPMGSSAAGADPYGTAIAEGPAGSKVKVIEGAPGSGAASSPGAADAAASAGGAGGGAGHRRDLRPRRVPAPAGADHRAGLGIRSDGCSGAACQARRRGSLTSAIP